MSNLTAGQFSSVFVKNVRNIKINNMGNEQSHIKGLEIDKKAIEVTDFWSLYTATVPHDDIKTPISIFQGGETLVLGQLWVNQSPLERAIKVC